jgi:hypothetical protein
MVSFPSCGQDIGSWSSDENEGGSGFCSDVDVPLTVAESGGGCSESVGRFIVRVTRQLDSQILLFTCIYFRSLSLVFFFSIFLFAIHCIILIFLGRKYIIIFIFKSKKTFIIFFNTKFM